MLKSTTRIKPLERSFEATFPDGSKRVFWQWYTQDPQGKDLWVSGAYENRGRARDETHQHALGEGWITGAEKLT